MKRTIKLAVVAALALGTTSVFATNGATMIAYGAKSFGMGGTGIGVSHGAESALANPALISTVENFEVSFGGTIFMPNVEVTNTLHNGVAPFTSGIAESKSDMFMIPSVSLSSKVNDNFYWGIGMWGTGGLGVDYRDTPSIMAGGTNMQMVTALQTMQFGVPLVYTSNNFAIGVTPLLQYGSLDINYEYPGSPNPLDPNSAGDQIGSGVNDDLQFGYNIGLSYETNGVTIGAVYKSEIEMEYKGVMSTVIAPFSATGAYGNDKLSTPAEYGIGVSYKVGEHTVAADYKMINWSDAKGYKDFEWQDQDVIALGYEFANDGWALRAGYQYAEMAVKEQTYAGTNSAGLSATTVNTFNLLGFPGTSESHVTCGGTYNFNDSLSLDLAVVVALETEETYTNFAGQPITTSHAETGISFQINKSF